jgi:hypothetical protein
MPGAQLPTLSYQANEPLIIQCGPADKCLIDQSLTCKASGAQVATRAREMFGPVVDSCFRASLFARFSQARSHSYCWRVEQWLLGREVLTQQREVSSGGAAAGAGGPCGVGQPMFSCSFYSHSARCNTPGGSTHLCWSSRAEGTINTSASSHWHP